MSEASATPTPDWHRYLPKAREVAMSLPPSDFGSHRAIEAFAKTLAEVVEPERETNARLTNALTKALRKLEEEFSHFAPSEPENRLINLCRVALTATRASITA